MTSIVLSNGPRLSWREYGVKEGTPVLYFHGMPGSCLEAAHADEAAKQLDIRLIAPERPGYGESDPQQRFTLLDWTKMVAELADALDLKRFSILGFSMGGTYALACAHELPERISNVVVVSTIAPFATPVAQEHINATFKPLYELAAVDYSAAVEQVTLMASSADAWLVAMESLMPSVDQEALKAPSLRQYYLANIAKAFESDVHGVVSDLHSYVNSWHFELNNINVPVDIWHGTDDTLFGCAVGQYIAETISAHKIHILEGDGHCFIFNQWENILEGLIQNR